jgi:hypothetical protein
LHFEFGFRIQSDLDLESQVITYVKSGPFAEWALLLLNILLRGCNTAVQQAVYEHVTQVMIMMMVVVMEEVGVVMVR